MPVEQVLQLLARCGTVDDDEFTAAVATLRALSAEADAGRRLADAVRDAFAVQPAAVGLALSAFYETVG